MMSERNGSFLGRGWATPPVFIKGPGMTLMNEGAENVNENLMNLLKTRLGERPFRALYGTDLSQMLFQPQTAIPLGELHTFIQASIERYEPRILVEEINLVLENEPVSKLIVQLTYQLIAVNSRHNFVFPFYLDEGTHLSVS